MLLADSLFEMTALMNMKPKIILLDKSEIFREGLAKIL